MKKLEDLTQITHTGDELSYILEDLYNTIDKLDTVVHVDGMSELAEELGYLMQSFDAINAVRTKLLKHAA